MARRGSARDGANTKSSGTILNSFSWHEGRGQDSPSKKWPPRTTKQRPLGNQKLELKTPYSHPNPNPNPKSLLLQQGDKASRPQEHSCLCDWGENTQSTPLRLQGRRVTKCRR
jgi:hypothetical protein